jgi:hypothetical protein
VAERAGAQDERVARFGIEHDAGAEIDDGVLIAPGRGVGHGAIDADVPDWGARSIAADKSASARRLLRAEPELPGLRQYLRPRLVGRRLGSSQASDLSLVGVGKLPIEASAIAAQWRAPLLPPACSQASAASSASSGRSLTSFMQPSVPAPPAWACRERNRGQGAGEQARRERHGIVSLIHRP